MYQELQAKTALNKLKGQRMPYQYDLNPFRGCSHGCAYCYALYSHQYLYANPDRIDSADFFNTVFVKTNIAQKLEERLSSKSWKKEIINIGSVCDSYQPAEAKYKLMPQILKILIKYESPVVISTKSRLILRDFDLIKKLADLTYVNIATTITTADEAIRRKIEPRASSSRARFEILNAFQKTKASRGLHVMPILPLITDSVQNLEALFKQAEKIKPDYVLAGALNLRSTTRKYYFQFLRREFPDLMPYYLKLYQNGRLDQGYKKRLRTGVAELKKKYHLSGDYIRPLQQRLKRPVKLEKRRKQGQKQEQEQAAKKTQLELFKD